MNELERVKTCLQPCIKYSGKPLKEQLAKLEEEVSEVKQALKQFKFAQDNVTKQALAIEIVDVIITSISFLYMLGYLSLTERLKVYELAFLKNVQRGYYKRDTPVKVKAFWDIGGSNE